MRSFAAALSVAALLLAAALPSAASAQSGVTVTGSFVDLDGLTIDGDESYDYELCFHEPVGNPLALEEVGVGNVDGHEWWIPPLRGMNASFTCEFFSVGREFDTSLLSEGEHTFRGNGGHGELVSDTWTFTIDR